MFGPILVNNVIFKNDILNKVNFPKFGPKNLIFKNDILTKVTFPKFGPKNLKDSDHLALYH